MERYRHNLINSPSSRRVHRALTDVESRPYPNVKKAGTEGDTLTRDEFMSWLVTGKNRFDRV